VRSSITAVPMHLAVRWSITAVPIAPAAHLELAHRVVLSVTSHVHASDYVTTLIAEA
jgi:hypothetical protein